MFAEYRAGAGKRKDLVASDTERPVNTAVSCTEATATTPVAPGVVPEAVATKVRGRLSDGITVHVNETDPPGASVATDAGVEAPTVAGPVVDSTAVRLVT